MTQKEESAASIEFKPSPGRVEIVMSAHGKRVRFTVTPMYAQELSGALLTAALEAYSGVRL